MAVAAHDQIHDPRHKNHGGNKIKRYALFGRVCKTCSNLVRSPVASFSASRLSAHRGPAIRSTMRTGSVRHLRQRTAPRDRAARPWQPNKQSRDGNLSRLGFFFSLIPSSQCHTQHSSLVEAFPRRFSLGRCHGRSATWPCLSFAVLRRVLWWCPARAW